MSEDQQDQHVTLDLPTNTLPTPPSTSLHLLPCQIDYSGPANVPTYFLVTPTPTTEDHSQAPSTYDATFRGRGLKGVEVEVPEGYVGFTLKESTPHPTSAALKHLRPDTTFTHFTTWQHTEIPTRTNDTVLKAMAWLDVANDLHAHVDASDVPEE
ncbi:Ribonuclease H2 subunit C [Rhizophlyctis rosea]|nr:Ribonuclease H2 subunit C [Rhizophlyctis rosea]